ncbi:MAG TPA: hypothetical protein DCQ30_09750, partial [Acidimicrobiaceae bacterium]|nr:hypothetical protein [Acidimicrobiaceae bacterium]
MPSLQRRARQRRRCSGCPRPSRSCSCAWAAAWRCGGWAAGASSCSTGCPHTNVRSSTPTPAWRRDAEPRDGRAGVGPLCTCAPTPLVTGAAHLVVAAGAAAGVVALSRPGRRRRTPGAGGDHARWAGRRDLRPLVVRRPGGGRLVLGAACGHLIAAERGHSVLVVGPTQSYKTSGLAVPALLEWGGPVLAASVKSDLVTHTRAWRGRQGAVWLFDPTASTGLVADHWSPLTSARTWAGARRVAHSLCAAARPDSSSLADVDFWYSSAAKLLAPLLLAAAVSRRTMADVVRWVDEQEQLEVADSLFAAGERQALQAARATWARDDR